MTADTLINRERAARVLLVEDNHGDVLLMKRAFKQAKIKNELTIATTGEQALAMLQKQNDYHAFQTPDIILLDLNLPKMSGLEVLDSIKQDVNLRSIPVLILSSSRAERDVAQSYKLHASAYLIKPVNVEDINDIVQKMEQFWFTLAVTPEVSSMTKIKKT